LDSRSFLALEEQLLQDWKMKHSKEQAVSLRGELAKHIYIYIYIYQIINLHGAQEAHGDHRAQAGGLPAGRPAAAGVRRRAAGGELANGQS